jgi:extracellular matrix regulatory protein B
MKWRRDEMFLHIGGDVVIPAKSIIAIFDIETTTISRDTRDFLRVAEEEGFISSISMDLPKSFIITEAGKKSKIYLSPISSVTLQKRFGYLDEISNNMISANNVGGKHV